MLGNTWALQAVLDRWDRSRQPSLVLDIVLRLGRYTNMGVMMSVAGCLYTQIMIAGTSIGNGSVDEFIWRDNGYHRWGADSRIC